MRFVRLLLKAAAKRFGYRIERARPRHGVAPARRSARQAITDVDVRFHVGAWRYLVPTELMVGRPCFGYGPDSWHPFVATARQLLEDPDLEYEESTLHQIYLSWTPASIADAQFPGRPAPHPVLTRIPAATLFEPWQVHPPPCDDPLDPLCKAPGAPLFGPVGRSRGLREFERLRGAVLSISRYGYDPDGFRRGLITGVVLKHDGKQRFLVVHGQHRTAILAALGVEEVEVGIRGNGPRAVESSLVSSWPHVASGLVPADVAVAQLDRYFDDAARRRVKATFQRMPESGG